MKTLIQWIMGQIDGKSYRAGKASGYHHPKVDNMLLQQLGGRENLITQAKAIEKDPALGGKVTFDWWKMGSEIKAIHFAVDVMPELCKREGVEDPRIRQLRYIEILQGWKKRAEQTWLEEYYDEQIRRLAEGNLTQTAQGNLEDGHLYRCLDAILRLEEPVEKPIFSARLFRDVTVRGKNGERITPSKIFRSVYETKVLGILTRSPAYAEGMSGDEVLEAHGILTYAQTLEWKGSLVYQLNTGEEIDTSGNRYGTIINAQTLDHGLPKRLPGIKKIFTIENKANYEKQKFREGELYIYCHGFFSPKEVRFLKKITEVAKEGTRYCHWGDLDYGGIRIFQFNKKHVFPELVPYKMGRDDYEAALDAGAGVELEEYKREKCEKMDAGELEELQACILEYGLEIEQELLV